MENSASSVEAIVLPGRAPPIPVGERGRLGTIQTFRGLAALLVAAFHLTGLSEGRWQHRCAGGLFSMGWAGVDLFFVLSGFIIFFVHGRDIGRPQRLRAFAWKRFARIYPIYAIVTVALVPLYLSGYGESFKRDPWVIARSLLLLPQEAGVTPVITVGWSLSYEALFYLFFGLLILLPARRAWGLFGVWMGLVLTATVASAWQRMDLGSLHPLVSLVLAARNLEFGLGCLCGWIVARGLRGGGWLLAAGVLGFVAMGLQEDAHRWATTPTLRFCGFGLSSALIVAGAASLDLAKRVRTPRLFTFLGDASYSIYLTHGIVLVALVSVGHKLRLVEAVGAAAAQSLVFAVAIGVGAGVYHAIERPLLRRLRDVQVGPKTTVAALDCA